MKRENEKIITRYDNALATIFDLVDEIDTASEVVGDCEEYRKAETRLAKAIEILENSRAEFKELATRRYIDRLASNYKRSR